MLTGLPSPAVDALMPNEAAKPSVVAVMSPVFTTAMGLSSALVKLKMPVALPVSDVVLMSPVFSMPMGLRTFAAPSETAKMPVVKLTLLVTRSPLLKRSM
ncbi:MAG: hypothetical protein ACRECF_01600 [Methyloceanibacter sp.]